jgi:hypothetical protein
MVISRYHHAISDARDAGLGAGERWRHHVLDAVSLRVHVPEVVGEVLGRQSNVLSCCSKSKNVRLSGG